MNRVDVRELQYITPIANLPSILTHGILSNRRACGVEHLSIANAEVQGRRVSKPIPGTNKTIHDYANLYFDAHNPMLSTRRSENDHICIVRVSPDVLDLSGVVITDMNAARDSVRFYDVPAGLAALDRNRLYDKFWKHRDDPIEEDRHKALKCAEVLIPDCMEPRYLLGVFVANLRAETAYRALNLALPVRVRGDIFF